MKLEDRFLSKVKKLDDGCWEWQGARFVHGYGQLRIDGKLVKAHRISHELYSGEIPKDMCVCHRCDNKWCVNPSHLFIGTLADNNKDRHKKGRTVVPKLRGDDHPRAKINEMIVRVIRKLPKDLSNRWIAKLWDISYSQVANIRSGKQWRHV